MTLDLASITLPELNATAQLLTRVDRKYLLHTRQAGWLVESLPASSRVLEIDGSQELAYTSVYFDTPDRRSYLMAARGHPHRFKIRVRRYENSGDSFLEVKTRKGGSTVKQRIPHCGDLRTIAQEQYKFIHATLIASGVHTIHPEWFSPTLTTTYTRTTLLTPDGKSRLTIDNNLRWDAAGSKLRLPDLTIIETKCSSASPSPADRLLWATGVRPQRISKFATGLAALNPELPANRWHRILNRHF